MYSIFQITQSKYRVAIIKKNSIEVKNDITDIAGEYDYPGILVLEDKLLHLMSNWIGLKYWARLHIAQHDYSCSWTRLIFSVKIMIVYQRAREKLQ